MGKSRAGSSDLGQYESTQSTSLGAVRIGMSDESSRLECLREELAALRSVDRQRQRTHLWLLISILLASLVGAGFGIGAFVVSRRGNAANAASCSPAGSLPPLFPPLFIVTLRLLLISFFKFGNNYFPSAICSSSVACMQQLLTAKCLELAASVRRV